MKIENILLKQLKKDFKILFIMYKHKNGITLVKLEESDLNLLKILKNESWFGTHKINFVNDLNQKRWFENINDNNTLILKAINDLTGEDVGLYKINNIDWINRKYDSAHDVFKDKRGEGYSKKILEAGVDFGFEILNMNRLDTEVLENNIASLKSAIWVGFIKEGIKKKSIYKCNQYLDSIFLGIIRSDWEELDRVKKYNGVCNFSYTPKNN
jgi:RimJ/RimL family protein N-acetyltransferase